MHFELQISPLILCCVFHFAYGVFWYVKILNFNVIILIRCFFYGLCFSCYILKILFLSLLYSFCDCMSDLLDKCLCSFEERIMIYKLLSCSMVWIPATPAGMSKRPNWWTAPWPSLCLQLQLLLPLVTILCRFLSSLFSSNLQFFPLFSAGLTNLEEYPL